jgi:hypothetical protein
MYQLLKLYSIVCVIVNDEYARMWNETLVCLFEAIFVEGLWKTTKLLSGLELVPPECGYTLQLRRFLPLPVIAM